MSTRICRIVTVPTAAIQLQDQLNALAASGFEITLISSMEDLYDEKGGIKLTDIAFDKRIRLIPLPIERNISPWRDLKSLFGLWKIFRTNRFDVVHSMTPKAGLLTSLAGFLARVPVRMHTFTGQRWVNIHGPFRFLLKSADRLMSIFMTDLYADSPGQARFLEDEGIVWGPKKIKVLLEGSIAGVDLSRFNAERLLPLKNKFRRDNGLSENATLAIFVGRLTADKGIPELVDAFIELKKTDSKNTELILLGPTEPDLHQNHPETLKKIEGHSHIHTFGFRKNVEEFLAMSDFMCLPSHREGFGGVVIQAAALGLPTIGTHIYALQDSIQDGKTGVLVPVNDRERLKQALQDFVENRDRTKKLGEAARIRAQKYFDSKVVNHAVGDEYLRAISLSNSQPK